MSYSRPPRTPFASPEPAIPPRPLSDRIGWDPARGVFVVPMSPQAEIRGRAERRLALLKAGLGPRDRSGQDATWRAWEAQRLNPRPIVAELRRERSLKALIQAWRAMRRRHARFAVVRRDVGVGA